jgi:hypothetical protein
MATYDSDNGSWRANDGSIHYSEQEAYKADMGIGKGGSDDKVMSWMTMAFIWLFIFGPILFAKLVGFIWGLLLKLGPVGKVITTILMLFAGPFILMFPVMMFASVAGGVSAGAIGNAIMTIIMAVFAVASAIIPAAWYYIWHYDAVRLMGATVFSHIIQNFAKFFWFGFIAAGLISLASPGFGGFIALAACAAGFIYYFKATKEYRAEALANPSKNISDKAKRTVMMIVLGILVLTAGLTTVSVIVSGIQSKVAAAKIASDAAKLKAGDFVEVKDNSYYKTIRISVNKDTVVKEVKAGDILTVTGKSEISTDKDWYVPVEHEGNRGYIKMKYISLTDKRPTVTTTSEPLFNLNSITEPDNNETETNNSETESDSQSW